MGHFHKALLVSFPIDYLILHLRQNFIFVKTGKSFCAEADVEVFLSAKDRRLGVAVSVLDADGRCVAKGRKDNIDGTATSSVCVPVTVSSPRLWQGKEDPPF